MTLVRELLRQVISGEVAGLPSPHVIRLSSSGAVTVEGPVAAGGVSVPRAAQLLESLLPSATGESEFRVPGGLKLLLARAVGTLDLPPIASIEAFSDALERFAAADGTMALGKLASTWETFVAAKPAALAPVEVAQAAEPVPPAQVEPFVSRLTTLTESAAGALTVSDIRRARRATGLSLSQVAQRSRIPVGLLRQLEWGYLLNWPAGHYGRTQLVRYARAAGLDDQLVVSTLMPLILEADAGRPAAGGREPAVTSRHVEEPPIDVVVTPVPPSWMAQRGRERHDRLKRLAIAGLAIPAMVALGFIPAFWLHSRDGAGSTSATSTSATSTGAQPNGVPAASEPSAASAAHPRELAGRSGASPDGSGNTLPGTSGTAAARPGTESPRGRDTRSRDASDLPDAYRLTPAGVTYSPSFASTGTAMFYHAQEDGSAPLLRADTDGGGTVLRITRIVDDSANNFHVRPSPDGRRIAFDSDRDGVRGVYLADADGKNVRRVSPEGYAAVPSWSPDGSTLAFIREEASRPKVWNLWTLQLQTGELRQLTRYRYGQPWGGSWFPDGRRIAYSHEYRLVVLNLETGEERAFKSPRSGHMVRTPAVSPDGQRIMFQVHRDGAWLLELGDGSMRRVLDDPTAEEYTWSPDGTRVAYHSRKTGVWGVWVMAPRLAKLSP